VELNQRVPAHHVREAVWELRSKKGMVLDEADHDTWSAGSFFTNPIIPVATLPEGAPQFPVEQGPGWVKTSAAWLISNSGIPRGFSLGSQAALSTKHVLALTNRGQATASELVTLARYVRDHVHDHYGITLVPEPVLVGVEL
ncbi:MAG TPA: UDP-N-acetylenolpyruvoylglucosamine reductase, partial [Beutenbergiaceae bacterium]|nr:UDP-N-acetylenolpyruvoylglucosamine reductase [Beutenbergiaceae bacterium]